MSAYREFRFFSPALDIDAVRISTTDAVGHEYYAVIPSAMGKSWRSRREEALNALDDAIAEGREPGEVRVPESEGVTPR